jgi:hypothetical protein
LESVFSEAIQDDKEVKLKDNITQI